MAERITTDSSSPNRSGAESTQDQPGAPAIIVVNDDPAQLRLVSTILHRQGFAVMPCQSAEDALNILAERGTVDLIVTDLHMRGIDGWRFCQLLRSPEYPALHNVPILVLSATYSGVDAEQITAQLGANAFLPAPYDSVTLIDFVRQLLTGRQPRERARVLIVDDRPESAKQIQRAFEARGYAALTASSIDRGWQLYRAFTPHAVVLRHRRPDLLPEELLDEVKQPGSPSVAIAITDDDDGHLALTLTRRGADGFVREPFVPDFVVDLCEAARRQRALLRVEELLEQRTRQLQQSEALFRTLFEAFPEIVLVYDQHWRILRANPAAAARLEYPVDDLAGMSMAEVIVADAQQAALQTPAMSVARVMHGIETTYLTRGGNRLSVEVDESFIIFNGEPAILSVARDISARKEAERQRADFVSMMAHDIRNPLGVVLGYGEMVREAGPLTGDQDELLHRIEMNAQSVVTLLSNYLDLSRIDAQSLKVNQRPLQVDDVARRVAQRYESEANRRGITLDVPVEDSLPDVAADPLALERVLANLLHNAIKFTPDGGDVRMSLASSPGEVRVTIADTGPGIAPDDLELIFERFRRVNAHGFGVGTGLGLFIAKALVEAQGGRIEVSSTIGKGSAFTVVLPAPAGTAAASVEEPQRATA